MPALAHSLTVDPDTGQPLTAAEMDKKRIMWQVEHLDSSVVCPTLEDAMEYLRYEDVPGATYTLTSVEMLLGELKELPDFTGF